MSIIVTFGSVIIVIILMQLMYKMKHRRFYKLLEKFPSYPTYPLIGNINLVCGPEDLLRKIEKICLRFDRLVFWAGPVPIVVLRKYDDILTVSNKCLEREFYTLPDEWIGFGILTTPYEEWIKSRKILAPAFNSDMLSKYMDVFNKSGSSLVEKIKLVADTDEEIDVMHYIMNENLDSIIENTTGVSMKNSGENGEEFYTAISEAIQSEARRVMSPWLYPRYIFMLYLKMTGKIEYIKLLQNFPNKMMKHRSNNMHNQNIQLDNVDSSRTVTDLLVKEGYTETRIRDELLQIFAAGMGATALNVSFLMLMLAIHQDVQQKVYEEIIQTTGGNDTITEDQSLHQFKYLEQCIRETMRVYSQVTVTSRRTHKECILKGNLIIPANAIVFLLIDLASRDSEVIRNPDKWDPEHFSEQAIAEQPKGFAQLSFGLGPRSCIGAKYAMMSIKAQIYHILLNYHLSTHIKEFTKYDTMMDLSIISKIGYPVKFTSRKKT